jgi:hypothetical protein
VAALLAVLVVVDGLLVMSWRSLGPTVTLSIVAVLLGAVGAWLRRRGDRLLTVIVVYVQVVLGIGVSVGVAAYVYSWGQTLTEHHRDCGSNTCIWYSGDVGHAALIGGAVALALAGLTAPVGWYWWGTHPHHGRKIRAGLAGGLAVVLAAVGVGWSVWDGTASTATSHTQGISAESEVIMQYVNLITGINLGKDESGYQRALDQMSPTDRHRIPPALSRLTCSDPAGQRQILSVLWPYRDAELSHPGYRYNWEALPSKEAVHGDRATVPVTMTGTVADFSSDDGGSADLGSSEWRFELVKEFRADGRGWHVCRMVKTRDWHLE